MRSFAAVGGDLRRGDAQMRGARAASSWQDTQKIFCVGCQLLAGNETNILCLCYCRRIVVSEGTAAEAQSNLSVR